MTFISSSYDTIVLKKATAEFSECSDSRNWSNRAEFRQAVNKLAV